MGGGFQVGLDPNTPPPSPPTQTNVWQWGITNLGSNGARTIFLRFVRGLENWLHPMCSIPKCSNLNGEFKSFIFPHNLAPKLPLLAAATLPASFERGSPQPTRGPCGPKDCLVRGESCGDDHMPMTWGYMQALYPLLYGPRPRNGNRHQCRSILQPPRCLEFSSAFLVLCRANGQDRTDPPPPPL